MKILSPAFAGLMLLVPAGGLVSEASAHCDTLDGPVVSDARIAIAEEKPDAVLKWIRSSDEAEVLAAFQEMLTVRRRAPDAAELAERWFFENLVRIHRAGEGAPYDGLKDAAVDAAVAYADQAIASGDARALLDLASRHISSELRTRFERVHAAAAHKDHTPEAGRAYVEAYVDFVHYAESVLRKPHAQAAQPASSTHAH